MVAAVRAAAGEGCGGKGVVARVLEATEAANEVAVLVVASGGSVGGGEWRRCGWRRCGSR